MTAEAVLVLDRDRRVVYVNRSVERALGIGHDELAGHRLSETDLKISAPDGSPISSEDHPLVRSLVGGKPIYDIEYLIERTDGSRVLVSVDAFPLRNADNEVIAVILALVVKRKLTVDEGFETGPTEDLAEHILGLIDEAIVVVDRDFRIVYVNPAVERAIGIERKRLIGLRFPNPQWHFTTLDGEPLSLDQRPLYEAMSTRKPIRGSSYVIKPPGGGRVVVSVNAIPLVDKGGMVVGVIGAFTNISALEEARAERKKHEEALEEKDRAIRQAYVDVLSAVTGGRLILMAPDELESALGNPVTDQFTIGSYEELSGARRLISEALKKDFTSLRNPEKYLVPAGEALTNVVKHAGGGWFRVYKKELTAQILIADHGPGIDFTVLPKATLVSGFSTKVSLGLGFTIMLEMCDRVLLSTQPGTTTVVLEGIGE
ncbi:MAG: PAS domain-containing protein [Candidatus Aquicultorales bacterium]